MPTSHRLPFCVLSCFSLGTLAVLVAASVSAPARAQEPARTAGALDATAPRAPSAEGSAPTVRATADKDGIEWTGLDGQVQKMVHRSLTQDPKVRVVGPVTTVKGVFYAAHGDLFRIDLNAGAVVERFFFGAQIIALKSTAEGGLDVRIDLDRISESMPRSAWFPAFRRAADSIFVPGQGTWGAWVRSAFRPLRDLPEGTGDKLFEEVPKTSAGLKALDAELVSLLQRDRTNPYAHAYRAVVAKADARDKDVAGLLSAALTTTGMTWIDLYRLCSISQILEQPKLATKACDKASADLDKRGIRKAQVTSPVAMVMAFRPAVHQIEAALATKDAAKARALMEHIHNAYPSIEYNEAPYALFSDWLVKTGNADGASLWAKRATARQKTAIIDAPRADRRVRRFALAWIGFHLALFPLAIAIGLRSGRRARERDEVETAPSTWREVLPLPAWTDAVWAAVAVGLLVFLASAVASDVNRINTYAVAPEAALNDALDSPAISAWVEKNKTPSDALQSLDAFAKHAYQQAEKGLAPTQEKPSVAVVNAVFAAESGAMKLSALLERVRVGYSTTTSLIMLVLALLLAFGAHTVARRVAGVGRGLAYFVPGAPAVFTWVAPLLLGGLAIAVLVKAKMVSNLLGSAGMGTVPLYGMKSLASPPFGEGTVAEALGLNVGFEATTWADWLIAAVVLLHIGAVIVDVIAWRRERKSA